MSEKTPREQIALLKNVIEDLQERVQTASESIRAIVQTLDEQHDEAAQPDFERLRYESEKQAYEGHPAARSAMPEMYFLLLVSILTAADATEAQWRHLYRTAAGTSYEADVRDLLPDAYSLTDAKLIEAVESIKRDELTNAFVLDCILLALLQEGDAAALLAYIADLFALLGAEKDVVRETMQAAKTIVAQDREAYLTAMADMSYLDARDSCRYLFHSDIISVMNDLVQPEDITSKHLIVVGLNETNIELDLDTWKAEKITFRNCILENGKITSSQKEVHFIGCTFCESAPNIGGTEITMEKISFFTKCQFKCIASERCILSLFYATLESCMFSDCSVRETQLLNLTGGTITNSKFVRCRCDANGDMITWNYLVRVEKSTVKQCIFSSCKTNDSRDGSSAIILVNNDSTIEDCQFEQCFTQKSNAFFFSAGYIICLSSSTQTNNTFHDCTCNKHVG